MTNESSLKLFWAWDTFLCVWLAKYTVEELIIWSPTEFVRLLTYKQMSL